METTDTRLTCHAYQILRKGGLKEENIVVFMYDDIANHPLNPHPGTLINHPDGDDVYSGVPKDYNGKNVTAANFYAVLLGDQNSVKDGSGKVIASKPNDHIFVCLLGSWWSRSSWNAKHASCVCG